MATLNSPEFAKAQPSELTFVSSTRPEPKRFSRRTFVRGLVGAGAALTVAPALASLDPGIARAQAEPAVTNPDLTPVIDAPALAAPAAEPSEGSETTAQVISPSPSQIDRPQPFIPPERPERNPKFPDTSNNNYFRPGDQPEYSRFNEDEDFNKGYMFDLYTTMTSLRNLQNPDDPINLFDKYGYELWSRNRNPITNLAKIYIFLYDKKSYREGPIQTPFYPVLGSDEEPGKIAVGPGVDMTLIRGTPARSTLSIGTFALTMCMVNNRAIEFGSSGKSPADFSNEIKGNSIETAAAIGLALDTILPSLLELNNQASEFGIIESGEMTGLVTEYHRASLNTSESERKIAKAEVIKDKFGFDNPVADIAGRLR